MADIDSEDLVRQATLRSHLPDPVRSRIDDLLSLSSNRLETLLGSQVNGASDDSQFASPTSGAEETKGEPLSFRDVPQTSPRVTRFIVEQEFEGMVVAVDPDCAFFVARLADLTANRPVEEAEIGFDEVSLDDKALIVPGAVFSWHIGRSTETGGQVRRISEVRFRRFFRFAASAIARAEEDAARMLELLK